MFHAGHLEKIPIEIKTRTFQVDAGLTETQFSSLHNSFATYAFSGPEDSEGYVRYGEDGYSLRIRLWDLADYTKTSTIPVELVTQDINEETLRMILDIALSSNMILINSVGKKVRYVGRDPGTSDLEKWTDAVRLDTTDELRSWLTEDIGGRSVDIYPDE